MSVEPAVLIDRVRHCYGAREALRNVSFEVRSGEIFGLLGPNGGGKTTLLRILSTSIAPLGGRAAVFGFDVVGQARQVRPRIGVVFQSPSLDKKLSAAENLWHHGHLYGLRGNSLRRQVHEMLERVGLADRAGDRIEKLSGGMQRRAEVAKCLLHRPRLLLMDEPSTGLDPGARRDLWEYLTYTRERDGLTILLTTHLMDEAEQCDRVAILHHGEMVALGAPMELSATVADEIISLESRSPHQLAEQIRLRLSLHCTVLDKTVQIERARGHELVAQLFETFPGEIQSVTVRRPTLDDVFVQKTGHRFGEADDENLNSPI